jgi:hypothetical protein
MHMDAVIGCDAVDAGAEWLRLKTAAGAVRTVPWSAIKIAGTGGNHAGHMQIQDVTERVSPYFDTHESLWIVYAEGGFAQIMLEKASPKREAILAECGQRLGIGWRGDEFTSRELTDALFQMPVSTGKGIPKIITIMIAAMAALIIVAIAAGYIASHRSQ